jgi:hypothetical protein
MSRLKKQRHQFRALAASGDASALSYKERFTALAQRAEALAGALQEAEDNLNLENKKRLALERQNAEYSDSLQRVRLVSMSTMTVYDARRFRNLVRGALLVTIFN